VFVKAPVSIVAKTESASKVTDTKAEVDAKANIPIDVTDFGISIDVRPEPSKALSRIVSNAASFANVTVVNREFFKASNPIDVTPSGMVAVPVQSPPLPTTVSVTVNVPVVQATVTMWGAAHAGDAGKPSVPAATTVSAIRAAPRVPAVGCRGPVGER
jgi:hypothetical protein